MKHVVYLLSYPLVLLAPVTPAPGPAARMVRLLPLPKLTRGLTWLRLGFICCMQRFHRLGTERIHFTSQSQEIPSTARYGTNVSGKQLCKEKSSV